MANLSKRELIEYSIIAAIIIPFMVFSFPSIAGAEESFVVQSGSMEPAIPTGSAILIYKTNTSEIQEGDIITYQAGSLPTTTHRVIDIQGEGDGLFFRTKGDANEDIDQARVYPGDIKGEVGLTVPYIGHLLALTTSIRGLALLILLPALILIGGEIRKIYSEMKTHEEAGDPETAHYSLLLGAAAIMLLSAITAGILNFTMDIETEITAAIIIGGFILTSLMLLTVSWIYRDKPNQENLTPA